MVLRDLFLYHTKDYPRKHTIAQEVKKAKKQGLVVSLGYTANLDHKK